MSLHNDLGHLGIGRTVALARDRFYWPRMTSDIEEWIKHCDRCLARNSFPKVAAPLQHIKTSSPMELVCMNFVRVAKVLWEQYFRHNGLPKRLHSDQGPEFESKVIQQLTTMLGVQKSHTTPYHPQGNPQPERFNRTLLNMLGTLTKEEKINWSRHVSALVHAYNCTKHDNTGYSPYFLMFGREARLPIGVCFGVSPDNYSNIDHSKYVTGLRQNLQEAYELATTEAQKQAAANKRRYDERVKGSELQPGNRVLVRLVSLKGKHKLADQWNTNPYIVIEKYETSLCMWWNSRMTITILGKHCIGIS